MKEFGEQLGLDTMVDKAGNVIIKKPATKDMENRPIVVMQRVCNQKMLRQHEKARKNRTWLKFNKNLIIQMTILTEFPRHHSQALIIRVNDKRVKFASDRTMVFH